MTVSLTRSTGAAAAMGPGVHTGSMLARMTWLLRVAACVLIAILTFVTNPPTGADLALEWAGFVICLVVVLWWLVIDLQLVGLGARPLLFPMGVMAVVAGVLSIAPHGGALIGFSVLAVVAAGADAAWLPGWAVGALAVLSVEVGALIFGSSNDTVWGYPLILIVAFIGGRNRRAYVVQAEQSAAMIAQLERLRAEQAQVAVLDERNRIAREIHDVLAHSLGALGIHLQATRAVLENNDTVRAQGMLEQAQRMANDGLVDTRRAVQALRGDTARLDAQLASLVQTHRDRHRTAIDLQLAGDPVTLTPEASVALIRTAQEALVNTAKHAPHQPVEICLTYAADEVLLEVSNRLDGVAESSSFNSVNGGYGLLGMRERLMLINGTLAAGAEDPSRWTVLARVPR
jgi:signal transduction histidine kinase